MLSGRWKQLLGVEEPEAQLNPPGCWCRLPHPSPPLPPCPAGTVSFSPSLCWCWCETAVTCPLLLGINSSFDFRTLLASVNSSHSVLWHKGDAFCLQFCSDGGMRKLRMLWIENSSYFTLSSFVALGNLGLLVAPTQLKTLTEWGLERGLTFSGQCPSHSTGWNL